MNRYYISILSVVLLVCVNKCSSQHANRFLVNIVEQPPPFFNTSSFMCTGTVITASHVLTTAQCVEDTNLRISIEIGTVWTEEIIGWASNMSMAL